MPDEYDKFVQVFTMDERIVKVISGYDYTFLLTIFGRLYSFGCNSDMQLGHTDPALASVPFFDDKPVRDVDVNFETTIVLTRVFNINNTMH